MPRWELSNFWTRKNRRAIIGERHIPSIGSLRFRYWRSWQPSRSSELREKKGVVSEKKRTQIWKSWWTSGQKNSYCKVDSFDVEHFFEPACLKQRNQHQSLSATQAVCTRTAQVEPWGTLRPIPWQSVALPFPRQISPGSSLPTPEEKGLSMYSSLSIFILRLDAGLHRPIWNDSKSVDFFIDAGAKKIKQALTRHRGAQLSRPREKLKRPKTKMNSAHQALWTLTRATISASVCLSISVPLVSLLATQRVSQTL